MTPSLVDVILDQKGSEARILTFRVLLDRKEAESIMRATACTTDALPTVLRDEILGTVNCLIDKGNHGMTADALIANGSIEVGRGTA